MSNKNVIPPLPEAMHRIAGKFGFREKYKSEFLITDTEVMMSQVAHDSMTDMTGRFPGLYYLGRYWRAYYNEINHLFWLVQDSECPAILRTEMRPIVISDWKALMGIQ